MFKGSLFKQKYLSSTLWAPKYCSFLHLLSINSQSTEAVVFNSLTLAAHGDHQRRFLKTLIPLPEPQASYTRTGWEPTCLIWPLPSPPLKLSSLGSPVTSNYQNLVLKLIFMSWYHITTSLWNFSFFWSCCDTLLLLCFLSLHRWADWSVVQPNTDGTSDCALTSITSLILLCLSDPWLYHLNALAQSPDWREALTFINSYCKLERLTPCACSFPDFCSLFKPSEVGRIANHISQILPLITPIYLLVAFHEKSGWTVAPFLRSAFHGLRLVRRLTTSRALFSFFTCCCWWDFSLGLGDETDPFPHLSFLTSGTMLELTLSENILLGSQALFLIIKWNLIFHFTTITACCLWNCI